MVNEHPPISQRYIIWFVLKIARIFIILDRYKRIKRNIYYFRSIHLEEEKIIYEGINILSL